MDASVLGISLQKRENSGPVYIKERECYFTKRNVASHSMHHNESAECMSGEKKIHSLSSENYLLRRILSFWASIKGCNSKFDKKGGNNLHRGPQLLFLSYLLLLSSENLLYRHFPLSSLYYTNTYLSLLSDYIISMGRKILEDKKS